MRTSIISRPKIHFTNDHEWVDCNGRAGFIGVSCYKLKGIRKIDYIKWHRQWGTVSRGVLVAEIHTEDRKIPVYAPVSCIILGSNPKLAGSLELVLESPQNDGWLFSITTLGLDDKELLLSAEEYQKLTLS